MEQQPEVLFHWWVTDKGKHICLQGGLRKAHVTRSLGAKQNAKILQQREVYSGMLHGAQIMQNKEIFNIWKIMSFFLEHKAVGSLYL